MITILDHTMYGKVKIGKIYNSLYLSQSISCTYNTTYYIHIFIFKNVSNNFHINVVLFYLKLVGPPSGIFNQKLNINIKKKLKKKRSLYSTEQLFILKDKKFKKKFQSNKKLKNIKINYECLNRQCH